MAGPLYIAVDLGAGSGRVFIGGVDPGELLLEEIHRFRYPPSRRNGFERWEFAKILEEIKVGLRKSADRAEILGRQVASLGVDSWAVDYGLLDAQGSLIDDPVCYRDARTDGVMERVFARVSREEIFERTGIQFQQFNTIYQLWAEDRLGEAEMMLLLPDLINYFLTGRIAAEFTNATTTQLVNARTQDWDGDLLKGLQLPAKVLPAIVTAGTDLGLLTPDVAEEVGLDQARVIAPATHDTASAIAGAPLDAGSAYISSGTWSLIGVELSEPLINDQVAAHNFTNEGGAYGTIRFLKNVMGLWIFESCRREWQASGEAVDYESLLSEVGTINGFAGFIFPDDQSLLNPPSMVAAISEQMRETGQECDNKPSSVAKIIFDSLAFRYASVLASIRELTGRDLLQIEVLGGGSRNEYLNQITADATGLTVRSGVSEATVLGNVLVQAIAAGRFHSLTDARSHVRENVEFKCFHPVSSVQLEDARARYNVIEGRFGL